MHIHAQGFARLVPEQEMQGTESKVGEMSAVGNVAYHEVAGEVRIGPGRAGQANPEASRKLTASSVTG